MKNQNQKIKKTFLCNVLNKKSKNKKTKKVIINEYIFYFIYNK